jgi:hypothetical protein
MSPPRPNGARVNFPLLEKSNTEFGVGNEGKQLSREFASD